MGGGEGRGERGMAPRATHLAMLLIDQQWFMLYGMFSGLYSVGCKVMLHQKKLKNCGEIRVFKIVISVW